MKRKGEEMEKLIFLAESSDEIIAEVDITDEEMQKLTQGAEEEGVTLEVYILSILEEAFAAMSQSRLGHKDTDNAFELQF